MVFGSTGIEPAEGASGYTMVAFHTRRDTTALPDVWVHLAQHPATGRLRIIGVWPS